MKLLNPRMHFEDYLPRKPRQQLFAFRQRQVAIRSYWNRDNKKVAILNCSSGFLISNEVILTAAHNVYSSDLNQVASLLKIFLKSDDKKINSDSNCIMVKPKLNHNIMIDCKQSGKGGYRIDLALIKIPRLGVH